MDELWQLERQIQNLQRELQYQREQAFKMRQEIVEDNLKKLNDYQAKMQSELDRHDREVQKEYDRLLKEYQNSINEELEYQQLKRDIEYRKLHMNTKEKEKEWKEKTQKLQELIDELKKNGADKENVSENEAKKYMTEAVIAYKQVEKKPHEKFYPKRITVYYNAIREARTLFERGLNEAAIAISISAKSGANRLGYDIDDRLEEWQRQYLILKNMTEALSIKLDDEIDEWCRYSDTLLHGEKDRENVRTVINFWSKGEYGKIYHYIEKLQNEIAVAETNGIETYLKTENSMSVEDIRNDINRLNDFEEEFKDIKVLYKNRYRASCERQDYGEQMIHFLTDEINLSWIDEESYFRAASPQVLKSEDYIRYMRCFFGEDYETSDMREWLELVFETSSDIKILIYIVPQKEGNEIQNRVVLYIDYGMIENAEYSRQIYRHVCESINVEEDSGIVKFSQDIGQLKTNFDRMLSEAGKSIEKKIREMKAR